VAQGESAERSVRGDNAQKGNEKPIRKGGIRVGDPEAKIEKIGAQKKGRQRVGEQMPTEQTLDVAGSKGTSLCETRKRKKKARAKIKGGSCAKRVITKEKKAGRLTRPERLNPKKN